MVFGQGSLSGICIGGRTFGGLGLKGRSYESSLRNMFQGSLTEEGKVSGKSIFEGGFKFTASESRNQFNRTASTDLGDIGEQLLVIYEK